MLRSITFPQPGKPITLNNRLTWRALNAHKQGWRTAAYYGAVAAMPHPDLRRWDERTLVEVSFPVTTNRRRDPHNWILTVKWIIDGLVDANVWPDDSQEWVRTIDPTFHLHDKLVHVTITEAP